MKQRRLLNRFLVAALVMGVIHGARASTHGQEKAAAPLNRVELHRLEAIAARAESMMTVAKNVSTRVWPHGVRDKQGRLGLFIGSSRPLFDDTSATAAQFREAWVVFGMVAAVKYCEGSQVGHIAFTDVRGMFGEQWYYDLDMGDAQEIHRLLIHGLIQPAGAYRMIVSSWQKVTVNHDLAVQ